MFPGFPEFAVLASIYWESPEPGSGSLVFQGTKPVTVAVLDPELPVKICQHLNDDLWLVSLVCSLRGKGSCIWGASKKFPPDSLTMQDIAAEYTAEQLAGKVISFLLLFICKFVADSEEPAVHRLSLQVGDNSKNRLLPEGFPVQFCAVLLDILLSQSPLGHKE